MPRRVFIGMVFTPYGAFRTRADELMKQAPFGYIDHLMNLPPDAPVRLYSYQGQEAWDRAERTGYWTGPREHIESEDHDWCDAYQWLRARMAERVPNFSGDYPMWGWIKRPSAKPKPRKYRGVSDNIRLTVLVPRSRIVFSDYDNWHSVLNSNLNCRTEREWDEHCELFPRHHSCGGDEYRQSYFESIEPSWHDTLSFVPSTDPEVIRWQGTTKYFRVQACADRFHWNEIVDVRRFEI